MGGKGGGGGGLFGLHKKMNEMIAEQINNSPEQVALRAEKKRQAQEASDQAASRELSDALSKQKNFAAKAQGKAGTLLTGSLGVAGSQTGEQVAGQKTLLGT